MQYWQPIIHKDTMHFYEYCDEFRGKKKPQ
jgi:hypothetical protein